MTMNVVPIQVGQRIKSIRLRLGMTTDDFGKLFIPTASKGTISKWENGRYLPNNTRLVKIADLGGITVDKLLYGKSVDPVVELLEQEIAKLAPTGDYSQGLLEGLKRAKEILLKNKNL